VSTAPDHGAWTRAPGACAARLFQAEIGYAALTAVPWEVIYGAGKLQGPWPLTCQREPHEGSPWHWDDGTWWK
jgi:hypothetical protein